MKKNFQIYWTVALIAIVSLFACAPPSPNLQQSGALRVDADGHHLYMLVAGNGNPTIILESGLGDTMESWAKVQPEVAKLSQVVSYDRAGLGHSESGPKPRTAQQIAAELHTALKNAGIAPPYVMVGHSAGGLYVRVFASMYASEIAGMVLIDPTPENFFERLKASQSPEEQKKFEEKKKDYAAQASEGRLDEWMSLDVDLGQARAAVPLPDVPIILLTGMADEPDKSPAAKQLWLNLHNEWLKQIPNARHLITNKSGHYIQIDEPELVIDAIRQVIGSVEGKSRRTSQLIQPDSPQRNSHQP